MNADADPYTNVIPGFIPDADLTREGAHEHLGERLQTFARRLAEAGIVIADGPAPTAGGQVAA